MGACLTTDERRRPTTDDDRPTTFEVVWRRATADDDGRPKSDARRWRRLLRQSLGPGHAPPPSEEHYPAASEKPWHDLGFLHRLQAIHFPYVCDLYGVFRSQDETLVATSFCQEGDLGSFRLV